MKIKELESMLISGNCKVIKDECEKVSLVELRRELRKELYEFMRVYNCWSSKVYSWCERRDNYKESERVWKLFVKVSNEFGYVFKKDEKELWNSFVEEV